jgi:hypothetical protein
MTQLLLLILAALIQLVLILAALTQFAVIQLRLNL